MRLSALKKSPSVLANVSVFQGTSQAIEVNYFRLNTKTTYQAVRAAAKVLGLDKRYI